MALVKYNNNSISTISSAGQLAQGSLVPIKTLTASGSATLSFVDGSDGVVLDNTYKEYVFYFTSMHPSDNGPYFQVNFRDGGSSYDTVKTTSFFNARHNEDDATASLSYNSSNDLAQGTGNQFIDGFGINNDNDSCISGNLHLFNPSSTTFVKHFIINTSGHSPASNNFIAGYCNTTTAIDGVQFSFQSGNIDAGKIKLYGIKDS